METSHHIRFIHLRQFNADRGEYQHNAGTTIAYEVTDNEIRYSVARCNPREHFCKRVGRQVASGRLLANKCTVIPATAEQIAKPIDAILAFL